MKNSAAACCTSPAALCYWLTASLIAWGALSLVGIYWHPLRASSATGCLVAMASGCFANWLRNRSYHCIVTGPLFLLAGVALLLSDERLIHLDAQSVWSLVLVGVVIAFLLEWRYAKRAAS
jgi:hypothetical protein